MNIPTCDRCSSRASWRQSNYLAGGNVIVIRACDKHATGIGWERAYSPSSSN